MGRFRERSPLWFLAICVFWAVGLYAYDFTVVGRVRDGKHVLEFSGQTDTYYQVHTTTNLAGPWSVVGVQPVVAGPRIWSNTVPAQLSNSISYYKVLEIPRGTPRDADADGMHDLYELAWPFLDPLSGADAYQDQDGDTLYNIGEFVLGTSPTNKDSDADWASDGYEVYTGTNPTNPASAPTLEFRINANALYTGSTNVTLVFGGLVADEVSVAETVEMANSRTSALAGAVSYSLNGAVNGWRTLFAKLRRTATGAQSRVLTASIILDTEPPVLNVTNPVNNLVTDQRFVSVSGSATDTTSAVEVRVNGEWTDGAGKSLFVAHNVELDEGLNPLEITASDGAGHTVTQILTVIRDTSGDTVPPTVSLLLPADFQVVGGVTSYLGTTTFGDSEITDVRGQVSDPSAEVFLHARSWLGTNGPIAASVVGTQFWGEIALYPGTNQLAATATDAAGNTSTATYSVIRNMSFFFAITNPAPYQVLNGTQIVVSGSASASFTGAVITVNGIAASVQLDGTNATFKTTSPVLLAPGKTAIEGRAVLNGRSYFADPPVVSYSQFWWGREYSNHYSSLWYNTYGDFFTTFGWWTRDDYWSGVIGQLVTHHCQDVEYCDHIMGGTECDRDIQDNTVITAQTQPVQYGYFGAEHIRYDYTYLGQPAWDQDLVIIHDEIGYVCDTANADPKSKAVFLFPGMGYSLPPGSLVDPALITFRGRPGFLLADGVAFTGNLQSGLPGYIRESDFTWPAFSYFGSRTDRREWYPAGTLSKVHLLHFNSMSCAVLKVVIKPVQSATYPMRDCVLSVRTATGNDQVLMAYPNHVDGVAHQWTARTEPAVEGSAGLFYERSGAEHPVAWDGTPADLAFVTGTLNSAFILTEGGGAAPLAHIRSGYVQIDNMRLGDRIIVRHTPTDAEASAAVVKNFTIADLDNLGGPGALHLTPALAGLTSAFASNVLNTLRFCMDDSPLSAQAQEREAMQVLHPPLAALDIPSSWGLGALPGDFMHAHITYTGSVPAAATAALNSYKAIETETKAALGMGSWFNFAEKPQRDAMRKLRDMMAPHTVTLLNTLASIPGAVLVYHTDEWVAQGYVAPGASLQPGDPIRNLRTNLSASDTTTHGAINDPDLVYPGSASDANAIYTTYDLHGLMDIKFYCETDGTVQLFVAPIDSQTTSIEVLQLGSLLDN